MKNGQVTTQQSNPIFSDIDLSKINNYSHLLVFLIKDFINWWYIQMPIFYISKLERISIVLLDKLSISILIKNFFLPYSEHKNTSKYLLSIILKLTYLPISLTLYLITNLIIITLIIFWLLLPIITLLFIIISFFNN